MKCATVWVVFALVVSLVSDARQALAEEKVVSSRPVIAGYIAAWKKLSSTNLPANQVSHLVYAFGALSSAGLAQLANLCIDRGLCNRDSAPSGDGGNFAQLAWLKLANPHLRILISLGGWTGSKYFSDAALTEQSRENFAHSIIDVFFRPYPGLFDGIDIDWEYPVVGGAKGNHYRPEDGANFLALMTKIRHKLDALATSDGRRYELTAALSADAETLSHLDLKALAGIADWLGVMTYDYHAGAFIAGFNAPLFAADAAAPSDENSNKNNIDASIRYFINAGVPPQKLVLGIPFYGRAYRDVADAGRHGYLQPGQPAHDWGGEDGIDYKDILSRHPQQLGFERHWDEKAQVPWLYNRQQKIWISYDDPKSIASKAAYARSRGLAGVMIWELGGDDGSLLPAVRRGLGMQ